MFIWCSLTLTCPDSTGILACSGIICGVPVVVRYFVMQCLKFVFFVGILPLTAGIHRHLEMLGIMELVPRAEFLQKGEDGSCN
jgi:hypothetical protein